MVDDSARAERDRMACTDGADVQVDVLRGDEPPVEPSNLVEHGLAVGEVGGRIGDVGPFDDELDALELLEGTVADLDRPAGDHVAAPQAFPELLEPERVRDRVAVDERDGFAPRLPDSEVPAGPSRPARDIEADALVPPFIAAHDIAGRVLAGGVDDNDFERRLLGDPTVQQSGEVPRLVAHPPDAALQPCGS